MNIDVTEKQQEVHYLTAPGLEAALVGVVEVPAREVEFVERAYRWSLVWLGCIGAMSIGVLGSQLVL